MTEARLASLYAFLVLVLSAIAFSAFAQPVRADELDNAVGEIVQDFQRHIGQVPEGQKYYVVVRSFSDQDSGKATKVCREVEDSIVEQVLERFAEKRNIIVLERSRIESLEKEVAFEANRTHFSTDDWTKKMGKKLGAGFLITGTVSKQSRQVKIRAKMIDITTSQVVASSSSSVRLDDLDPGLFSDYPKEKDAEPAAKPATQTRGKKISAASEDEEEAPAPKKKSAQKPAPEDDYDDPTPSPKKSSEPSYPQQSYPQPQASPWPAQQYPQQPVLASFCCDMWGNRRCQLVSPVAVGDGCFCPGQGYGIACP